MAKHAPPAAPVRTIEERTSTAIFQLIRDNNVPKLIECVEAGVSRSVVKSLPAALGATHSLLADLLDISEKSIQRLMKTSLHAVVSRQISERTVRLMQIRQKAVDVFENEEQALAWLIEPNEAFAGRSPLVHARTELGCRQIETVLDRIDHGVFS